MDNPFSKSAPASAVTTRRAQTDVRRRFSPSYGVHHGYIKDPNWPPAHFPESGAAAARRTRRVEARFEVEFSDGTKSVLGDVSAGGAMFVLDERRVERQVVVAVKAMRARAEVLSVSLKNGRYAHHCQFVDVEEGQAVFEAISS